MSVIDSSEGGRTRRRHFWTAVMAHAAEPVVASATVASDPKIPPGIELTTTLGDGLG